MFLAKFRHDFLGRSEVTRLDISQTLTNGRVNFCLFVGRRVLDSPKIAQFLQRFSTARLKLILSEAVKAIKFAVSYRHGAVIHYELNPIIEDTTPLPKRLRKELLRFRKCRGEAGDARKKTEDPAGPAREFPPDPLGFWEEGQCAEASLPAITTACEK